MSELYMYFVMSRVTSVYVESKFNFTHRESEIENNVHLALYAKIYRKRDI